MRKLVNKVFYDTLASEKITSLLEMCYKILCVTKFFKNICIDFLHNQYLRIKLVYCL